MSYSTPGPKREIFKAASAPKVVVTQRKAQAAGTGDPPIPRLIRANQARIAALRAQDEQLARAALSDVVDDLSSLLDSATRHILQSGKHTSKQVKKVAKKELAASIVAELPLIDIADLLGLPPAQIQAALASVRAHGAMDEASREAALHQIRLLRRQLQLVVATQDHSLLDKLVALIVKIAQAIAVAASAAAAGTLVVGGSPVSGAVVKAMIVALVTIMLQDAADGTRDKRIAGNPYTAAREALADLIGELASPAGSPEATPAYELERPVLQIRLLVKTFKAQQTLLDTQWEGKPICWDVLRELPAHIERMSVSRGDELDQSLRKLRALRDNVPAG